MNQSSTQAKSAKWLYAVTSLVFLLACSPALETSEVLETEPEAESTSAPASTALPPTATLQDTEEPPTIMPFEITSASFAEGEVIPARYACTGDNLSPNLAWSQPPADTASVAMIFDDPDAPGGSWVHWLLYNLPANAGSLPEGLSPLAENPDGSLSGSNSWGELGYGGPCPPQGSTHHYIFAFYALDLSLDLESGATKQDLLAAMEGHILAEAQITGLFSR